ncbi:hypothetical protein KBB12_03510 [Candidatus Woesebacteria bacterium]|nr:hypothetical protein [Candidatus Woesebacteria bacterium]
MSRNQIWFDKLTQILLPILTVVGLTLTANRMPKPGFIISSISQIFWLYTSYQSYKKAGQVGILITTVIMTFVNIYGIYSWWFR